MNAAKPTLIVIAGPTAVGKTSIAIDLAKELDTEIISADSRQCYQGMAIGTAQPSLAERAAVKHHFVDCFLPSKSLTAADFERFALEQLHQIFEHKNTAIVCGGTGLYIKALCEGLDDMPAIDEQINQEINIQYQKYGMQWLQDYLRKEDPDFFSSGEIQNPARVLRALVFKLSSGKSINDFRTASKKERPFNIIKIGLELPREILYQRINKRVDIMIDDGLVKEVEALFAQRHLKNLNTVGYSEIFDFIEGKCSLPQAIEKIKQHSRNYAKRQLTWFRKDPNFHWLVADDKNIMSDLRKILTF